MIDPSEQLVQEDLPEATVIRVRAHTLSGDDRLSAIKKILFHLVETGKHRLILDLTDVDYLSSADLGTLLNVRNRLRANGGSFQPPCRRRGLFAFFRDREEAAKAIRQGETDAMLLCGVKPLIIELLQVCGIEGSP